MARQRVTQGPISDLLGIAQTAVSRRLRGEVAFSLDELESIAGFLGVPLVHLLADDRAQGAA